MSEFDWIARYFAPLVRSEGAAGLMDDVAVFSPDGRIVTVDALVEGVHFLPEDPIDTVARKLVRVNVSDLIAKGALPHEAVLTLGWSRRRSEVELQRFAEAFGAELKAYDACLIGGDTVVSSGPLFFSLTMTGRPATQRAPVRRSGARPGDLIYVTGQIGGGGIGLEDAKAGRQTRAADHYRVPEIPPRVIAEQIGQFATASMDVSDGLLADAQKLLAASGCGAEILLDAVPYFSPTTALESALKQATSGDDYQCLFTAPADYTPQLSHVTGIGKVTDTSEICLVWQGNSIKMPKQAGFQHV